MSGALNAAVLRPRGLTVSHIAADSVFQEMPACYVATPENRIVTLMMIMGMLTVPARMDSITGSNESTRPVTERTRAIKA